MKSPYFIFTLQGREERKLNPINVRTENLRIIYKNGKKLDERNFSIRVYTPAEISFLLRLTEIKAEKFYDSFNFEPFNVGSGKLIISRKE